MKAFASIKILISTIVICCVSIKAISQNHPLDPLSATEIKKVISILKADNLVAGVPLFNVINLKEPPKKEVLAWQPGMPYRREAFASFYNYSKNGITEAVVDLVTGKVISATNIPNVIGMGLEADSIASDIVKKIRPGWPRWREGIFLLILLRIVPRSRVIWV